MIYVCVFVPIDWFYMNIWVFWIYFHTLFCIKVTFPAVHRDIGFCSVHLHNGHPFQDGKLMWALLASPHSCAWGTVTGWTCGGTCQFSCCNGCNPAEQGQSTAGCHVEEKASIRCSRGNTWIQWIFDVFFVYEFINVNDVNMLIDHVDTCGSCGLFWQSIVPDLFDLPSIVMVDDLLDGWMIWTYVNFGNSCNSVSWMNDKIW